MNNNDLQIIQGQIGYHFKNQDLLQQAFVRRSYARENGGEDNEVLEFIGDKALDFAVVRLLAQKYGHMINGDPIDGTKLSVWEEMERQNRRTRINEETSYNEYVCDYDEGRLSELRKKLVEKRTLAQRIDDLGLAEYLIMGKGDVRNNVSRVDSVKEDLFEAILGAVALDCGWDMQEIFETAEIMLEPEQYLLNDDNENYVELVQEWALWKNGEIPFYHFETASLYSSYHFNGISQTFSDFGSRDAQHIKYQCLLKIDDEIPIFRGFGSSKSKARMSVCKVAYDYLQKKNLVFSIRDEIENPNKAEAINQLETLARRGYFSLPSYEFEQEYDGNGNPVWKCECLIEEYDTFYYAKSSSKKDAKKAAAYEMLKHVLGP